MIISIHSPHARGDRAVSQDGRDATISIHSPHARGDSSESGLSHDSNYFNPLPSYEERQYRYVNGAYFHISIHSPHTRGDVLVQETDELSGRFQSTPLMRGETSRRAPRRTHPCISIHSPHARGDYKKERIDLHGTHFNPLPSCEGRRRKRKALDDPAAFQSTPLMRGETKAALADINRQLISIHSPHARGDPLGIGHVLFSPHFNPLPSCEGRQNTEVGLTPTYAISIHSPHARGDWPTR